jgi:predicted nucleotidyltransferase
MGARNTDGSERGRKVIDAAVRAAREQLGDGLVSAYAIGSLGHGGFSAVASDVDLALLTADLPEGALDVEAIAEEVGREIQDPLAERLSVFHAPWSRFSAPGPEDRFPPIDRLDLMRSGVLVFGEDLRATHGTEPPAEEVIENSIASALRRNTPDALRSEVEALTAGEIDGRTTPKIVLWPVRLLHTIDTASAAGNEEAAAYYRDLTDPPPRHLPLVEASLRWRTGDVADGTDALAALRSELLPLYAEIYGRLAGREIPRADEVAIRAEQFAAVAG